MFNMCIYIYIYIYNEMHCNYIILAVTLDLTHE